MSGERIRSIKPEWLEDENLGTVSDSARMVSVALIVLADDHGNGRAHPLWMASRIWPYSSRDPRETLASLSDSLSELARVGFVRLYSVKGQAYYALPGWKKHQRVDKPGKPRVPGPEHADSGLDTPESSGGFTHSENPSRDTRETLAPDLDLELDQEGEGEESARGAEPPPPPPELSSQRPGERVASTDAAAEWHIAAGKPGAGSPGSVFHAEHAWRRDYETVASVCNVEQAPRLALRALCLWFWCAPDGPVQSGRVPRNRAKPSQLAKHVSEDLDRAFAWWAQQRPEAAE